jgi:hypothetical protein
VAFADALFTRLEESYGQFCAGGFAPLRARWDQLSCLTGRRVRIGGAGPTQEGTVAGMGDDGTLRLRAEDGSEMRVVAGDVSVLDGYGSATRTWREGTRDFMLHGECMETITTDACRAARRPIGGRSVEGRRAQPMF